MPVHPVPIEGETLSSWLDRLGSPYHLHGDEVLLHFLDVAVDPRVEQTNHADDALIAGLSEITGVEPSRIQAMTINGTPPWSRWEENRGPTVGLALSEFSADVPEERVAFLQAATDKRACPACVAVAPELTAKIPWLCSAVTTCVDHGINLKGCWSGSRTVHFKEHVDAPPLAPPSEPLLRMDKRSSEAFTTGWVRLPGGNLDALAWFRLIQSAVEEVRAPQTRQRRQRPLIAEAWLNAGYDEPVRVQATRRFEKIASPYREYYLRAAAHLMALVEDQDTTAAGAFATVLRPRPPDRSVTLDVRELQAGMNEAFEQMFSLARESHRVALFIYCLQCAPSHTEEAADKALDFMRTQLHVPERTLSELYWIRPVNPFLVGWFGNEKPKPPWRGG